MASVPANFTSSAVRNARNAAPRRRVVPPQLMDGVRAFLILVKKCPDLDAAVLAAILAKPTVEWESLLEAARSANVSGGHRTRSASMDSDDVWEDAVEELDVAKVDVPSTRPLPSEQPVDSTPAAGDEAPPGVALEDLAAEVESLQREAQDCHQTWQRTRQLASWTRYTECRGRLAELSAAGPAGQAEAAERPRAEREEQAQQLEAARAQRWEQLVRQREVHERRLGELARRRERLRLTGHYMEQTRQHHARLSQAQLQATLRELDERHEARRLQLHQRLRQLRQEIEDDDDAEERRAKGKARTKRAASCRRQHVPTPSPPQSDSDEFTYVWDDENHWDRVMEDDDDDAAREDPVFEDLMYTAVGGARAKPLGPVGMRPQRRVQPDVVPPAAPRPTPSSSSSDSSSGPWWGAAGLGVQGSSRRLLADIRVAADPGFQERKRWFERALLSWHAQGEEASDTDNDAVLAPLVSPWLHTTWQGVLPTSVFVG